METLSDAAFCGIWSGPAREKWSTLLRVSLLQWVKDKSTLVGHFATSPRKREKRDRRDSGGDERKGQGRKRNRNDRDETEEIKIFPLPLPATRKASLAQLKTNISWTPQWRKIHDTFATPDHHPPDAAFCGIWSGSILFATHPLIFRNINK